ncbi:hypothetical protein F4825DRAFT_441339 [Nemania diffusa]|nr:hypothetical protein F4825DRAFT_441339 [Nemania diffusa]
MADSRNRKRSHADDHVLRESHNPNKKPRLSAGLNFPPEFWDRLSKVPLTRRALRELDRRNGIKSANVTPVLQEEVFSSNLARFAMYGGPNILHLRGYRQSSLAATLKLTSAKSSTSSRGPEFEQHLHDHGIYVNNLKSSPLNLQNVRERLRRPTPSLSLSRFSDEDFEDFVRKSYITNKKDVVRDILPVILGTTKIRSRGNFLFTEFESITDGTTSKPKPDVFDGAPLDDIDKRILADKHISALIVPTKHPIVPVAPNFFLEVKGPSSIPAVLRRQICYDGANGARAMHCLQNYGRESIYDGNAYTFSATYDHGSEVLALYAHHLTAPAVPGGKPEYHLTRVGGYLLSHNHETFVDGLTAFGNLRDMAQEFRDGFIKAANAHAQKDVVVEAHPDQKKG